MRILVLLAAGLVSACAVLPDVFTAIEPDRGFDQAKAVDVFETGFDSIHDRYIEKIPVSDLALAGLRGLGAIDPSLNISRDGNKIILSQGNKIFSQFSVSQGMGAHDWALLSARIVLNGRKISKELKDASDEKIYEAVFDGALANLDIYSRYAGAEEARNNREKREGFGGIGIRFRLNRGEIKVTWISPSGPAEQSDLRIGDIILRIDGDSVEGYKTRDVVKKLRGPENSLLRLTVLRTGERNNLSLDIRRAHIFSETITSWLEGGIGYFRIASFNQNTAGRMAAELKKAFAAHENKPGDKLKGLILDLRGNPGGVLKQSVKVANLFISGGKIVSTRGRHPSSIQYFEADGFDMAHKLPLVLLMDGKSASAAEIVAAAIQDRGRGVVIGTTSYGKGTVQTVIRLPNDGEITLTWSRLLAPSGYALHGLGVYPAICTSGRKGDGKALLASILNERVKTLDILVAWRQASFDDKELRRSLRISCPAERRNEGIEIEIARLILKDRNLYRLALSLTQSRPEQARMSP